MECQRDLSVRQNMSAEDLKETRGAIDNVIILCRFINTMVTLTVRTLKIVLCDAVDFMCCGEMLEKIVRLLHFFLHYLVI